MSFIVEHLKVKSSERQDCITGSITCEALFEKSGSAEAPPASKFIILRNTLIAAFYDLANRLEDAALVEKCNEIFLNPKKAKVDTSLDMGKKEGTIPDIDEAYAQLSTLLNKKVFLIIDAADRLSAADQEVLAKDCKNLLGQDSNRIKIIVSSRSNSAFLETLSEKDIPKISMDEANRGDIKLTVGQHLERLPGWTNAEREIAAKEVVDKAGPYFKYVVQVAIPFLSQPWQRPLENHLKALPEGLNETYNQYLRGLSPNYLQLLRTALTWTLMAEESVTVEEIMDSYSGAYTAPNQQDVPESEDAAVDEEAEQERTRVYVKQLQDAGGPFLELENKKGRWYVKLKDEASVRQYCSHNAKGAENGHETNSADDDHTCVKCKTSLKQSRALAIAEKEGHLQMALANIRHLNSPLFQRRYLKFDEDEDEDDAEEGKDEEKPAENGEAPAESTETADTSAEDAKEANGEAPPADKEEKKEEDAEKKDEEKDDDDSVDDEDRPDDGDWSWLEERGIEDEEEEEEEQFYRYEVIEWFYHARKAEALWTAEEKATNPDWISLQQEIDRFFTEKPKVFNAWQAEILENEGPWEPFQVAAYLDLTSVVKMYLDRGHDVNMLTKDKRNILHLAINFFTKPSATLKILLEAGADPNYDNEHSVLPFHLWVMWDAGIENVKEFIKHGASSTLRQSTFQFNVLHYIAWGNVTDNEVLDLLVDNPDQPDNRADINAMDKFGETPLHKLLGRKDISLDLLRAFLKKGADVNIDDKDSQRKRQSKSSESNQSC